MQRKTIYLTNYILLILFLITAGCSSSTEVQKSPEPDKKTNTGLNLDTVKAGRFDTGRMWTFEDAPVDYFTEEYNFTPTQEWFDNVRMAALRFSTYCSASFVSSDGLIMTNNHCGRESITEVTKEGEDLQENGFYAATLEEERRVDGLFVDQLIQIKDVTSEVQAVVDNAPDQEKSKTEKIIITEIERREETSPDLKASVTKLYNGGKYSLYIYKRYDDIRLVFSPESQLGYFGGDPDNFTYPRFNLDCTFFRVYDKDGNPLQTKHYFRWSDKGALEGEPVFVVGNPGTTNRLSTVAQLEYMRDIQYPRTLELIDGMINVYSSLLKNNPDDAGEINNELLSFTNSQKAYKGMLDGLRDPILMAKKKDFEKTFKTRVQQNPELNEKYGDLWSKIESIRNEMRQTSDELYGLSRHPLNTPVYFSIAEDMIYLAEELKLPESQRSEDFQETLLDSTIQSIFPDEINSEMQKMKLLTFVEKINKYLGEDYPLVQNITGGRKGMDAVNYMLSVSELTSKEKVTALAKRGADAILNSNDPFVKFFVNSEERRTELQKQSQKLVQSEKIYTLELGRAMFAVYGTSIPPDATLTLRISDGVVEGFPYNGTTAPPVTTFYGLYDRYFSFEGEFPWSLPEKWQNPPEDFNLETPFNFVSTNDIIGGNSGSPVINKKGEIVGLAFDGNIESLPGNFIFDTEKNRTVSVHSEGMIEAIKDMYKAVRLSDELDNGKLTSK